MARFRGPKSKVSRRYSEPIFGDSKALNKKNYPAGQHGRGRRRKLSEYAIQLSAKQKAKYIYGVLEKQFRGYYEEANRKQGKTGENLLILLETRLDNVVYRLGLAKTRRFARQMVSHGHVVVNGKKLNVPSHKVRVGDVITVREGSRQSVMFTNLAETHDVVSVPTWLSFDAKKLEGTVKGAPQYNPTETLFDPEQVMEFYSR